MLRPVVFAYLSLFVAGSAYAQITVTRARIGCLDIQTTPNLTAFVGRACNGRTTCSFRAPTPRQYRAAAVTPAQLECGDAALPTRPIAGVDNTP